jgi:anti-sigma factor (TIGR02949 family)
MESAHEEMSCKELVEVITDYLEGTMSAADRERFEAHLDECEYCVNYLGQIRETVAALGTLPEESLSDRARSELLAAFRNFR